MFLLPAAVLAQEGAPPAAPAGGTPAAVEQPAAPAAGTPAAVEQPAAPAAGAAGSATPAAAPAPATAPATGAPDSATPAAAAATSTEDFVRTDAYITPTGGTVWLPQQASVTAHNVDWMFDAVYWLSVVCFVGIAFAVVWFVWKYRARPGHKVQPSSHHNDVVETIWTVIPSLICVGLFVGGWRGYVDLTTPPKHALEIHVTARKWSWEFTHPNGVKDSVLHVPAGRSVRLIMKSEDVIHSFFVPAFRVKQDVLPRRYTNLWFKAEQPTVPADQELRSTEVSDANRNQVLRQIGHRLFCAEYCGTDHSQMKTRVVVHNPGGYDNYLAFKKEESDNMSPVERGQDVYTRLCFACHTTDGSTRVGPSFKGIWSETHNFIDGSTAVVDENYVRDSVLNPQAKVRQGFPPSMPSFQGQLSDKEILGVIEYIKSLKE
ncbi:MAG TPA: cytochrome c oxidase subunit II [Haliangium sp.]|nr:cytochrome c oxidase subunit II [Haliangium sp.]